MGLIPPETRASFRKGDQGTVVWAIQRGLDSLPAIQLVTDGDFAANTEQAVKVFQETHLLLADGIFGPQSSGALALTLESRVAIPIPDGLLRGLVSGESSDLIGQVNWSVPGGVDCSYVQRRVLERDYDDEAVVRRAFDAPYQLDLFAKTLRSRHDAFLSRPAVSTEERAWRLALLNHNYPYAADKLSRGPWKTSYSTSPQDWVKAIGAKFVDGIPVQTPRQWCRKYALGDPTHNDPGLMARYVESWATS